MDEIYDVVDEDGNKIREATWTEVHTQGLLHPTVAVLIFKDSSKKEVLLQKRSEKMRQTPGLWQHSAGGHILAGDTPDQAILKEIQEELFFEHALPKLEIKKITTFLQKDFPNNNEFLNLYETEYAGPFYPDQKEVAEEPVWMKWEELIESLKKDPEKYTPSFHCIMKEYPKPQSPNALE